MHTWPRIVFNTRGCNPPALHAKEQLIKSNPGPINYPCSICRRPYHRRMSAIQVFDILQYARLLGFTGRAVHHLSFHTHHDSMYSPHTQSDSLLLPSPVFPLDYRDTKKRPLLLLLQLRCLLLLYNFPLILTLTLTFLFFQALPLLLSELMLPLFQFCLLTCTKNTAIDDTTKRRQQQNNHNAEQITTNH